MKRIAALILVGTLGAALFAPPVRADEDSGPAAEHHHGHKGDKDKKDHKDKKDWLKKKLGLTDEQVKKLEASRKAHWEAVKPLRENLKDAMNKLKGELLIKASDDDVAAALKGVEDARQALRAQGEKFKADMEANLTPVQRAKMLVWRAKMRRHRMMAMGPGRHERCEGRDGRGGEGWKKGDRDGRKGDRDGREGGDDDGGPQSEE